MTAAVVAFGFPNPFELLGGAVSGLLGIGGAVIGDAFAKAIEWLVSSVLGALVDLAAAALGFFWDAAEPETGAAWFSGGASTPYGDMVLMAAPLLCVFFFAGVIQGVLRGDVAGMVRMALLRLPGAVVAMAVTVAGTDLLLGVTDEMSRQVLGGFRDDVEATTQMLGTVSLLTGPSGAAQFLMIVFGMIGLLAAVVLVVELFVRAALIYIVVALSPLIYAASVWETMKGAVRKLAELGLALILSKFVISVALALAGSAMTAAWGGNTSDPTQIPTPEAVAAASGTDIAQSVGILVGAIVMFGVAAFMPFVLFRLMPMAEGALVSQGIKSGPMRAAQQGSNAAMAARYNPAAAALAGRRQPTPAATTSIAGSAGAGPATAPVASSGPGQTGGGASGEPTQGGGGAVDAAGAALSSGAASRQPAGRDRGTWSMPPAPPRPTPAPTPAGGSGGRERRSGAGLFPSPPAPSQPVPGVVGGVAIAHVTNRGDVDPVTTKRGV